MNYELIKISLKVNFAKKRCTRDEVATSKGCFYALRVAFDSLLQIMQVNGVLTF